MLMQAKKKWLRVCVVSLGMAISQVNASGIPVVDAALNGMTQIENQLSQQHRLSTVAQWAKDVAHYATMVQNWKDNFKNMLRGQMTELLGFQIKAEQLNEQDLNKLLDKRNSDCNRITNLTSQRYCKEMVTLEKAKIKMTFAAIQEIEKQWGIYQEKVNEFNEISSQQGNTAGKLKTISEQISQILENITGSMGKYRQQVDVYDQRIELLRKARVQIAQEQMRGSNLTSSMTKAAVVTYIDNKTKSIQSNARTLRQRNNQVSNDEFNTHSKRQNQ